MEIPPTFHACTEWNKSCEPPSGTCVPVSQHGNSCSVSNGSYLDMLFGEKVAYPREGKGDYMFHFSLPLTFAREFCTSLPSNGSAPKVTSKNQLYIRTIGLLLESRYCLHFMFCFCQKLFARPESEIYTPIFALKSSQSVRGAP